MIGETWFRGVCEPERGGPLKAFAGIRGRVAGAFWSWGGLALCVLVLVAGVRIGTAGGQTPPAHAHVTALSGSVFKADGTLADGGRVTIETADGRVPQASAVDAAGHFIFTRLKAGTYNVRAYYQGQWSEWQRNVIVRHQKVTDITLRVVPAAAEKSKK